MLVHRQGIGAVVSEVPTWDRVEIVLFAHCPVAHLSTRLNLAQRLA